MRRPNRETRTDISTDLEGEGLQMSQPALNPHPGSSYGPWLSLDQDEVDLLVAADAAVSKAISTPNAAEVAASVAGDWRESVQTRSDNVSASRLRVLAIALSTSSPSLPPASLSSPIAVRRMDAVLDLLDVPLNSAGIQAAFLDVLQSLTDPNSGGSQISRAARDARTYAEYLGWVHPAIGVAADFGFRYLGERINAAAATAPVRDEQSELARAVLACQIAFDPAAQRSTAASIRTALLRDLKTAPASTSLPAHVLATAVAILTPLAGTPPTSAADAPDMTLWTLADARHISRILGITCEVEDDLKPGSKSRTILSESNWVIAAAEPQPTGTMHLLVRKRNDPTR